MWWSPAPPVWEKTSVSFRASTGLDLRRRVSGSTSIRTGSRPREIALLGFTRETDVYARVSMQVPSFLTHFRVPARLLGRQLAEVGAGRMAPDASTEGQDLQEGSGQNLRFCYRSGFAEIAGRLWQLAADRCARRKPRSARRRPSRRHKGRTHADMRILLGAWRTAAPCAPWSRPSRRPRSRWLVGRRLGKGLRPDRRYQGSASA